MTMLSPIPKGSSTGNLLLLLGSQTDVNEHQSALVSNGVKECAPQSAMHRIQSYPALVLHQHPEDHGIDIKHVRVDEPMHLSEQSSTDGPDALGIVDEFLTLHQEQILSSTSHALLQCDSSVSSSSPSNSPGSHSHAAGYEQTPQTSAHTDLSALHPSPEAAAIAHKIDDLPDDLLLTILQHLEPTHRHVASSTCERLLGLAQSTFHALSLALPTPPVGPIRANAAANAPASLRQNLAALPTHRFDSINRLELALPEITDKRQLRWLEDPCHPLNAWLGSYLVTGKAGAALSSLKIRAIALPQPCNVTNQQHSSQDQAASRAFNRQNRSISTVSRYSLSQDREGVAAGYEGNSSLYGGSLGRHTGPSNMEKAREAIQTLLPKEQGALVSGRALQLLATHCPALQILTLPLLAPSATAALPSLGSRLRSFSCGVQDSGVIDAVLQLRGLTSLRLALHNNLLSCVLQQQQVQALAQISSLRSLTLSGILLPDQDSAWKELTALSELAELRLSFPVPAERVQHLTQLRVLQVPTFSIGGLHHLTCLKALQELKTRQAACEAGMLALRELPQLHTLHLDSLRLSPPTAPVTATAAANNNVQAAVQGMGDAQAALPIAAAVNNLQENRIDVPAAVLAGQLLPPHVQQAVHVQPAVNQLPGNQQQQQNNGVPVITALHQLPGVASYEQGVPVDVWSAEESIKRKAPPHPAAYISSFYAGLQLEGVTCLVLTGVYVYHGELGALFPNLTSLAAPAVELPAALPPAAVPLRSLQRLAWPANSALPQLLAAAPDLTSLTITGVTSSTVLEQALGLTLPTESNTNIACKLEHLALVLQMTGSKLQKSRALRATFASMFSLPILANLSSLTLRDVPPKTATVTSKVTPARRSTSLPQRPSLQKELLSDEDDPDSAAGALDLAITSPLGSPAGTTGANLMRRLSLSRALSNETQYSNSSAARSLPKQGTYTTLAEECSTEYPDGHTSKKNGHTHNSSSHHIATAKHGPPADAHALATSGKVVDEGLLQIIFASAPSLRSLRLQGSGTLTCHGLVHAMQNASPHLEQLLVVGCPRIRQVAAEQLAADLNRPWLRVTWAP